MFGALLAGTAFTEGLRIALGLAVAAIAVTVPITLTLRHDTASTRTR
ncbi:hypothetical protein F8568_015020 [Actinomadura sp. LD22]|uniref:Uncharacterized protein n=1 Tax=Actinomadura physcomitrii TaxID=2650748 RepID=A0A6I4MD02_9ACTN|nr:hypothetical protein [Actinomadura physcomitrii]MWA01661.1 hypothetical protein [Actinomadura physcomitrii]